MGAIGWGRYTLGDDVELGSEPAPSLISRQLPEELLMAGVFAREPRNQCRQLIRPKNVMSASFDIDASGRSLRA